MSAARAFNVHDNDVPYETVRRQCASYEAEQLWEDRRFPHGDSALYRRNGRQQTFNNGQPIVWKRPHELRGAQREQLAFVKDGIDAGDVVQGELGDCYLLGAMASIASAGASAGASSHEPPLFRRLLRARENVLEDLRKGFVSFVLYRFGEWVEVTVDTLIPCTEQAEPIFAHCKDANEVWVQMLEKAYAKLHFSYEALDGGSVTAALVDLSGGVAETIDLLDEDEVQELYDGSMWRRLLRYASRADVDSKSGMYLLGAALSKAEVPDKGAGAESEVQVTDSGILVNHAYSILDVREVGTLDKTRLLCLRNPWGMHEWSGAWADKGPKGQGLEWDTKLGQELLQQTGYKFRDDGAFWISWEDFQGHFNRIYVCRVLNSVDGSRARPGDAVDGCSWYRYDVQSSWDAESAGGCFNFPSWRSNPQWEIRTSAETHAIFLLMQPDPRTIQGPCEGGGAEGGPQYKHKIGMYVMKGSEQYRRKVLFDSEEIEGDDVVDSTPYIQYREVQCNTMDEESESRLKADERFVLCPSTFQPNKLGPFRLVVFSESPLAQPPTALPRLRELRHSGRWTRESAGGCRNFWTWRRNEQLFLRLTRAARASVVLMRRDKDTEESETPLLGKKSKSKAARRKHRDREMCIGFSVATSGDASRRVVHLHEEAIIEKTPYSPNFEVAREFVSDSASTFVVVPSTYLPDMVGDFQLVVFTDDERASLYPLPAAGWQQQQLSGEWRGRSAAGSRNSASWVYNPLYSLRCSRDSALHAFLRQPTQQPTQPAEAPRYAGVGMYVTLDDEELSLDDVVAESGFRMKEEVHTEVRLVADKDYILIPMTYNKGVEMGFELELFSEQPIHVAKLSESEANRRRSDEVKRAAAATIQRAWALKHLRAELRKGDQARAASIAEDWFRRPSRDNDEGYGDINQALDVLEAAFIQLTGKAEAKGSFFPKMRERLATRGHKIADYDVCL